MHAALDIVQDLALTTTAMVLKAIDSFNYLVVSIYVTSGRSTNVQTFCNINCSNSSSLSLPSLDLPKLESPFWVPFER
nr:trafficking protein particle complex subunit 2-like [Tanacetum cinerariifolium]